ncbi:hypothetical protein [uncultured Modestobacter sp.]|uniref:hypothetical protein n=1 Tax=uncultured Modestobacter sp. TaxID=380048 RepID=UPI00262C09B1|nr:hypothetical protein [uncultured Modestobacter sp.]
MPPAPQVPVDLRHEPFRGSVVVQRGLLTADQLRARVWRRLFPDVYVYAAVPVTHQLRCRAAAGVLLPGAVVTGRSAAVLWGIDPVNDADDVELTVRPGSHPVRVPGLRVRRAAVDAREVCRRRGVRVTTPEATAVALARALPLEDAVIAIDQLTSSGLASLQRVQALAGAASGAGCRRAREACALADGLAESPQETRVRLVLGRSGLPAPVAQLPVHHDGRFVARVDFGWPEQRVALEYDGLWHAEPGQFARDRERLNRLQAAGWRVVFVTAGDLRRPDLVIARIADALAR